MLTDKDRFLRQTTSINPLLYTHLNTVSTINMDFLDLESKEEKEEQREEEIQNIDDDDAIFNDLRNVIEGELEVDKEKEKPKEKTKVSKIDPLLTDETEKKIYGVDKITKDDDNNDECNDPDNKYASDDMIVSSSDEDSGAEDGEENGKEKSLATMDVLDTSNDNERRKKLNKKINKISTEIENVKENLKKKISAMKKLNEDSEEYKKIRSKGKKIKNELNEKEKTKNKLEKKLNKIEKNYKEKILKKKQPEEKEEESNKENHDESGQEDEDQEEEEEEEKKEPEDILNKKIHLEYFKKIKFDYQTKYQEALTYWKNCKIDETFRQAIKTKLDFDFFVNYCNILHYASTIIVKDKSDGNSNSGSSSNGLNSKEFSNFIKIFHKSESDLLEKSIKKIDIPLVSKTLIHSLRASENVTILEHEFPNNLENEYRCSYSGDILKPGDSIYLIKTHVVPRVSKGTKKSKNNNGNATDKQQYAFGYFYMKRDIVGLPFKLHKKKIEPIETKEKESTVKINSTKKTESISLPDDILLPVLDVSNKIRCFTVRDSSNNTNKIIGEFILNPFVLSLKEIYDLICFSGIKYSEPIEFIHFGDVKNVNELNALLQKHETKESGKLVPRLFQFFASIYFLIDEKEKAFNNNNNNNSINKIIPETDPFDLDITPKTLTSSTSTSKFEFTLVNTISQPYLDYMAALSLNLENDFISNAFFTKLRTLKQTNALHKAYIDNPFFDVATSKTLLLNCQLFWQHFDVFISFFEYIIKSKQKIVLNLLLQKYTKMKNITLVNTPINTPIIPLISDQKQVPK